MTAAQIRTIREVLVYENKYLSLFDDEVEFPGDKNGRYLRAVWKCGYSVGVVPITDDGKVILARQFCYATQRQITQIPKGMGSTEMEPIVVAAMELSQELGATAKSLEHLVTLYVDPGFFQNPFHIYLASETAINHARSPEPSEVILDPVVIPLDEFGTEKIAEEVIDPLTLAAVNLARARLAAR